MNVYYMPVNLQILTYFCLTEIIIYLFIYFQIQRQRKIQAEILSVCWFTLQIPTVASAWAKWKPGVRGLVWSSLGVIGTQWLELRYCNMALRCLIRWPSSHMKHSSQQQCFDLDMIHVPLFIDEKTGLKMLNNFIEIV